MRSFFQQFMWKPRTSACPETARPQLLAWGYFSWWWRHRLRRFRRWCAGRGADYFYCFEWYHHSLSSTTFTRLTKADVFDHLKRRGLTPLSPAQRREEYFRYVEDMFIAQKDLHSYISYYRNRQVEFWPRWKVLVWRESLKSRTHLLALLELQENEADLLAEGVKKYGLLKKRCLLSTCTGSSGRPHGLWSFQRHESVCWTQGGNFVIELYVGYVQCI